jgi:PAS domain S-box-containing protein
MIIPDRRTILIVEDEPLVRLVTTEMMQREGYNVIAASSGEEAIKTVRLKPEISLILMDLELGAGIDGAMAAEEITKDYDIPVVFVSGHTDRESIKKVEEFASYGYIVKGLPGTVFRAYVKMAFNLHDAHKELKEKGQIIRESEEKYRKLVEQSHDGIYIYSENRFCFVNGRVSEITGFTKEDLLNMDLTELVHTDDRELVRGITEGRARGEAVPETYEMRIVRKDGKVRDLELAVSSISYNGTYAALGSARDVTERKQAEEKIKTSLKEKEVLLKEIHHRVKNNLAVIASILSLQSSVTADKKTKDILRECQNRAQTMALIHTHLYQSDNLARINFKKYVRTLADSVYRSYRLSPDNIVMNITAGDVSLDINTAIPLGLIVNELVSNAMKYAFPEGRSGQINIDLADSADGIVLKVSDNGVGFPENLDFRNTESLGLQLVITLVEQLTGSIELLRDRGTEFRITVRSGLP